MPGVAVGKFSFAGGEVSPEIQTRVDLEKYNSALKKAKNMIVHSAGGISNRSGTYYEGKTKLNDSPARVVPFEFNTEQRYAIELGHLYARMFLGGGGQIAVVEDEIDDWDIDTDYTLGDLVLQSGNVYYAKKAHVGHVPPNSVYWHPLPASGAYEINTPWEASILKSINYAQSADTLFMVTSTVRPKMLQRFDSARWTIEDYPFKEGPFMLPNTDDNIALDPSGTSGTITISANANLFNALHVGSLWQLRHYVPGQTANNSLASVAASPGVKCGGTWRLITHGKWTGKAQVEKSTDAGLTWTVMRAFSSDEDNNINTYGEDDNKGKPYLVRVNMTHYTSGTLGFDLTTDAFYQNGVVRITGFTDTENVEAFVESELGLSGPTVDWAEGSWSDYRGYPRTVTFSQDRLVFGGTKSEPQTEWMTETGNYYSFARHSPLVDSDGITINLPSRQLNGINGLITLLGLVTLTSGAEWTIGNTESPLTPKTVSAHPNSYYGSSGVSPVVIGNRAVYVQSSGNVIRDLGYDLYSNGFTGNNISILANHLFKGHKIIEMAYQQDPDSICWAVRDDGRLLSMTYLREQEVLAWTWHETAGLFESVCTIQGDGFNEVWFVVNRGGQRFIERMTQRMKTTDPKQQIFLDCALSYEGEPANIITGLGHLEGQEVGVLADGNVIANFEDPMTVVDGELVLPEETDAEIVHIGIPYQSDLETLNAEIPTKNGTSQGKFIKISDLILRVLNTSGGFIGPDFDTLHEISDSFRTNYDDPIALYTGEIPENLNAGYEPGARICVRQNDPLPITILALIPDLSIGGVAAVQ